MLLDKELSNILNDKKMNEDDKWYLYRQMLNQYCDKKRKNSDIKNETTQTIPIESKQTQTVAKRYINKKSNTEIIPQIDQSTETDKKIEHFFGDHNLQNLSPVSSNGEDERRLSSTSAAKKLIKKVNKKPVDPNKSYEIIDDGEGGYVTVSKNIEDDSIEELNLDDGTTLSKKKKQSTPKKSRLLRPSRNLPAQNCLNFPVRKVVTRTTTRNQTGKNYFQWENFM